MIPAMIPAMMNKVTAQSAHPVEHYIALWRSGEWPEVSTGE